MEQTLASVDASRLVEAIRIPGPGFYPTVYFPLDAVNELREEAFLFNSLDDLRANEPFSMLEISADLSSVDWAHETLLLALQWPTQFHYTYTVVDDVLTMQAAHLLPCDEIDPAAWVFYLGPVAVLYRTPKVSEVQISITSASYRFSDVTVEEGVCEKTPTQPVISGGGSPFVLAEEDHLRMWYGGFSATTGGVFDATSTDGIVWDPPGWDQDHFSTFDNHSPYPGHYGASVIRPSATLYWMFYVHDDPDHPQDSFIARSESVDGTHWQNETEVLTRGAQNTWDSEKVFSPTVLRREGLYWMWYAGLDTQGVVRIGAATSVDGQVWQRHGQNPVLEPGAPGAFDDLAVSAPAVTERDGILTLWYSAGSGGGDYRRPQASTLGRATSTDGILWTKSRDPLLGVTQSFERYGIGSAAAISADNDVLWYTAVNDRGEPSIVRAECRAAP